MPLPDAKVASDWQNKGDEFFDNRDFEGAIRCYDQVLEMFPRDPEIWNRKGLALTKLKRYDEAIECYDTALARYPKEIYLWKNKGAALNKLDKHIEAVRCFDAAIDIDPEDASAWCHKAISFELLKWHEESLECFETAIIIDPQHAAAWFGKGMVLMKLGREKEARFAMLEAKGFLKSDAILATILLGATPIEQVKPVFSCTSSMRCLANTSASSKSFTRLDTSRYASSMPPCSNLSARLLRISMMLLDAGT